MVGACASLETGADGTCTACTVAVGGLTPHATIVAAVGEAMVGNTVTAESVTAAAGEALAQIDDDITGDMHASADYRRQMLPVFITKALTTAHTRLS